MQDCQKHKEFLGQICAFLKKYVQGKGYQIHSEYKIPWSGIKETLWRKADIMIETSTRTFFIEVDINSDPSYSIVKYWPYLKKVLQRQPGAKITLIEIWKGGDARGRGYYELARFIGKRFEEMFRGFSYVLIEISDETPETIARWIMNIIER